MVLATSFVAAGLDVLILVGGQVLKRALTIVNCPGYSIPGDIIDEPP